MRLNEILIKMSMGREEGSEDKALCTPKFRDHKDEKGPEKQTK